MGAQINEETYNGCPGSSIKTEKRQKTIRNIVR